MRSPSQLIKPADLLIINQDWDKIRAAYNTLYQKINNNELSKDQFSLTVFNPTGITYGLTQYNMNSAGSVLRTDSGLSSNWDTWCGPLLFRLCPWYKQAVELFQPLNLQTITWSVTYEDIKLHVDPKVDDEKNFGQCKINYIVSAEDPTAETIVYAQDHPEVAAAYKSIPNSAWLLHTDSPHEVRCNGLREIMQFKFLNEFDEVAAFLDNYGPIRFDATQQ
jgi:hypothetical protein